MEQKISHWTATHYNMIIIIIMYIYHALMTTLGTHMIHINLKTIFCTHEGYCPTKTVYIN